MVFSSLTFLFLFLPVTLLFYYLIPGKGKDLVLFFFSLVFYAWGEPIYVLLMLYSILFNYRMGLSMDRHPEHAKGTFVFSIVINLFLLGFFKYYGFLVENINALFSWHIPAKELSLPIGISFYTFQALSYIIDLYYKRIDCQKNLIRFGVYITMFPQLIAGPIVRYSDIERELENRKLSFPRIGRGAQLFLFGLAKKVLLANTIGSLFDGIHALGGDVSCVTAWIGALSYAMQIYFDFSGYSDMAIGLGMMLGFTFPKNFDYPYISCSVTEFWRRWHISLGTWFREYVYIPLGGNRVVWWRHIFNILAVWTLTGIWHGAAWNFALWGLYYGVLLLWEKYVWSRVKHFPKMFGWIFTTFAVLIGWVIFSSDSLGGIFTTLGCMFRVNGQAWIDSLSLYYLRTNGALLVLGMVFCLPFADRLRSGFFMKNRAGRVGMAVFSAALLVLSIAFLATENYNPFLYFRF